MDTIKKDSGLTYDFKLEKGSFTFENGTDKKRKDLMFFMCFHFISRIYRPNFDPNVIWVLQKPASYVRNLKVLLLGNLSTKILSFIQNINILSTNLSYDRSEKEYSLFLEYSYITELESEEQDAVQINL